MLLLFWHDRSSTWCIHSRPFLSLVTLFSPLSSFPCFQRYWLLTCPLLMHSAEQINRGCKRQFPSSGYLHPAACWISTAPEAAEKAQSSGHNFDNDKPTEDKLRTDGQTERNERNKYWPDILISSQTAAIVVELHHVWDKDYLMLKLKPSLRGILNAENGILSK